MEKDNLLDLCKKSMNAKSLLEKSLIDREIANMLCSSKTASDELYGAMHGKNKGACGRHGGPRGKTKVYKAR